MSGLVLTAIAAFARAATVIVNDASDSLHDCAATGVGICSLRDAITFTNRNPGPDSIQFDIPGTGLHTIGLLSPLPALTDGATTIDAYSQLGSSPNTLSVGDDAILKIELDGTSAGSGASGLTLQSNRNLVRGLVINGFESGIWIQQGVSNLVNGSFIGTDSTGSLSLPNQFGVRVGPQSPAGPGGADPENAPTNTAIGSPEAADRNLISGNRSGGVAIVETSDTFIQNCYVGTNSDGTGSVPNGAGVVVSVASRTSIGSAASGGGNLISGNSGYGISIGFSLDCVIQGNVIGVDATGTRALPNLNGIVLFSYTSRATIGGAADGEGNVISGNTAHGVFLTSSEENTILGNKIGTDAGGSFGIGNGAKGVFIVFRSTGNRVGRDESGAGNLIAFNGGAGVAVGDLAVGNRISGNSIHDNGGLGIDLGDDGVTPNHHCGGAAGANNLQSFPVLTMASTGWVTIVKGTLDSAPNRTYRIEFFASPICDPSGYGQGQRYLGSTVVTTGPDCNADFRVVLPVWLRPTDVVTATATDPEGNTSEFSACVPLTS